MDTRGKSQAEPVARGLSFDGCAAYVADKIRKHGLKVAWLTAGHFEHALGHKATKLFDAAKEIVKNDTDTPADGIGNTNDGREDTQP